MPAMKKKAAKKKVSAPRKAKPAARKAAARPMAARRADYGKPIDGFFVKQPPHLRAILEKLRRLIAEEAPDATASLKWGMPWYELGGAPMCALGAHKAHVNLILPGPLDAYPDPRGRLEGESKLGKHLKLRSVDEVPVDDVRGWIRIAARLALAKAG